VFTIQADSTCPWMVSGLPSWLSLTGEGSRTGPDTVTLVASPNNGAARAASVMIAGVSVAVTQPAGVCTYALSPAGWSFTLSGGSGSLGIATGAGCPWSASTQASWVTINSAASGAGTAVVTFQVAVNTSAGGRSGTLSVAGRTFSIEQAGTLPSNAVFAGALPQVVSGGGWKTTFTITNTGTGSIAIRLNYWGDDGRELPLPMAFPQFSSAAPLQGPTLDRTIDAGATLIVESEADPASPVLAGWAELYSTGQVTAMAVFRLRSSAGQEQEAAVPLESRGASGYLLPFDNAAGYVSGIAAANHAAVAASLTVIQRDDAGRQIAVATLPLAAKGHASFDLKSRWPALADRRGSIEVRGAAGAFSILGLRFHPQGPFTTLPVAAK
jgi:hypothetical protein